MEQDNSDDEKILLKVVKHPFITSTILSHSLKKNVSTVDKLMEKFKRLGYVKYARRGLPKSWSITDVGIEKFGFEQESERKPPRRNNDSSQKGGGQGNNQSRGRRNNNQNRSNNQNRGNNQNRRQGGQNSKGKPKQTEEVPKEEPEEGNAVDGQRKGSRKERQEKINELFMFFKDHAEHSFTSQEIAPEFGITVSHLNSLLYELLGYGDVMKQFNTEEQQLVWYLDDMHLESNGKSQ